MRIKYGTAIEESEEELREVEQHWRGQKSADRVRLLRLLKSGRVKSLKEGAPVVGYSLPQVTRWWERYRAFGLASLLTQHKPKGQTEWITAEAWAGLTAEMQIGHIASLRDTQEYLERHRGICYKTNKSLSAVFKRHQIKWKTGRRRHQKAKPEQQQAFKKLPRDGENAARPASGRFR